MFRVTLPKKTGKVPLFLQTQKFPASFVDTQIGFTSHNAVSPSIEKTAPDNHQPLEGHFSSFQHTRLKVSVHGVRYLRTPYKPVLPWIPLFRSPPHLYRCVQHLSPSNICLLCFEERNSASEWPDHLKARRLEEQGSLSANLR